MRNPLEQLHPTLALGVVLAVMLAFILHSDAGAGYAQFVLRLLHVLFAIVWLGLLYYFNLVQMPAMARIPDEQKPAITRHIAPAALFWFRWAALLTVASGLAVALLNGYLAEALSLQPPARTIGIGMWLALVMAANVWFVIWPNQKKVLGLVAADPAAKQKAARLAMLVSRANTALSFPMLYCMVAQQNVG